MADPRPDRDEHAHGCIRSRRAARGGGDHDARALPIAPTPARVVLYTAPDCGLCRDAIDAVGQAQAELGFELDVVSIEGDEELEARYRVELPVVEIDGVRAFSYFVDPEELRQHLAVVPAGPEGPQAES